MNNIFRAGYTVIEIKSAYIANDFIMIDWVHPKISGAWYSTAVHRSKIDLQYEHNSIISDTYEVGGIRVNKEGYELIKELLFLKN